MKSEPSTLATGRCGFSLVEVLAAVAIIGIITFLALPNIVQLKQDSEMTLAISRAEAINLAIAGYIQANGFENAKTAWTAAGAEANPGEARYDLVAPYLAFAPANLGGNPGYMPFGYSITLPGALTRPMAKVGLTAPDGADAGTDPDVIVY